MWKCCEKNLLLTYLLIYLLTYLVSVNMSVVFARAIGPKKSTLLVIKRAYLIVNLF